MLPRFIEKDGRKIGKKIATATMTTAKIHASLGEFLFSLLFNTH